MFLKQIIIKIVGDNVTCSFHLFNYIHVESVHYKTSSAFGSLAHFVTSQISAVFGVFRWAYQVGKKGGCYFLCF